MKNLTQKQKHMVILRAGEISALDPFYKTVSEYTRLALEEFLNEKVNMEEMNFMIPEIEVTVKRVYHNMYFGKPKKPTYKRFEIESKDEVFEVLLWLTETYTMRAVTPGSPEDLKFTELSLKAIQVHEDLYGHLGEE